jgi:hypothetical protein
MRLAGRTKKRRKVERKRVKNKQNNSISRYENTFSLFLFFRG